jgi:fumarate reductase subunit D
MRRPRLSAMRVFWAAFVLLLASGVALWVAQFRDNHAAPWVSMGLAASAVVCTGLAVAMGRRDVRPELVPPAE